MSLTADGVWKAGVWASTVWADGVWSEGAAAVQTAASGGGYVNPIYIHKEYKKREEALREEISNLLDAAEGIEKAIPEIVEKAEIVREQLEIVSTLDVGRNYYAEMRNVSAQIQSLKKEITVIKERVRKDREFEELILLSQIL